MIRPDTLDSLRAAADAAGRMVGAAIAHDALSDDPAYRMLVRQEFSSVTPENVMKWAEVHPKPDTWALQPADALVAFAADHGLKVHGHTLLWHECLPQWVATAAITARELDRVVGDHVATLVGRYRGRVRSWDVVNEAIADDGTGLRPSVFASLLGPGYVARAFERAHQADPDALLFYNDYGAEGLGGKAARLYDLVRGLRDCGVPIHGVGLEMHVSVAVHPRPDDIAANVARLASLGLRVRISEMDVAIDGLGPEALRRQAAVYLDILSACLQVPACEAVTFWGVTDAHSWKLDGAPLLLGEASAPKPAYYAVVKAFLDTAERARAHPRPPGVPAGASPASGSPPDERDPPARWSRRRAAARRAGAPRPGRR